MKLVDLNILLYAINEDAPLHLVAKSWFERLLSGTETVAFSWSVLLGFLRLSTKAIIFVQPLAASEAFELVESWLAQPCVTVLEPTDRHLQILKIS